MTKIQSAETGERKAARRVKMNLWGNWNGYVGNRKVAEFGTNQSEAERWAGLRTDFLSDLDLKDKGEQCVYCGKDSWTCEHFEESNRDASGSLADEETDASRNV